MITDARALWSNHTIETDVCIVGTGPAGIALALEFVGQPFRVCLIEGGGEREKRRARCLYRGTNAGLPYRPLHDMRLRCFGGTSGLWAGWCRPLDPIDFEVRDWVPQSGWPFDRTHLDPFYERAQPLFQLGPYPYDVSTWETREVQRLPLDGDRVVTTIFQFSPPTRFGTTYRRVIDEAENVSVYLHANIVELITKPTGGTVRYLRGKTERGAEFRVRARDFVLAAGGIENARLLLLSNHGQRTGLGNGYDLVGRYFMEHPIADIGVFHPSRSGQDMPLYDFPPSACRDSAVRSSALCRPRLPHSGKRESQIVRRRSVLRPAIGHGRPTRPQGCSRSFRYVTR